MFLHTGFGETVAQIRLLLHLTQEIIDLLLNFSIITIGEGAFIFLFAQPLQAVALQAIEFAILARSFFSRA